MGSDKSAREAVAPLLFERITDVVEAWIAGRRKSWWSQMDLAVRAYELGRQTGRAETLADEEAVLEAASGFLRPIMRKKYILRFNHKTINLEAARADAFGCRTFVDGRTLVEAVNKAKETGHG